MAVFRIEKNRDYTVMSNHHLRDTELTLRSKGLMSLMLSLPENWDYSLRGLACICKERIDAIRVSLVELEKLGYIERRRVRNRDADGNIVSARMPDDSEYIYTYNSQNRVESETTPLGYETNYEYDGAGRVDRKTFAPQNAVTRYVYDSLGRL